MSRFVYGHARPSPVIPADVKLPDVLMMLGDLNYRINGFKKSVAQAIQQNRYDLLIKCDQLNIERALGNLPGFFQEGEIAFAPTFKRKEYDNLTFGLKRNPAWTDRILFFYKDDDEFPNTLEQKMYDSHNLVNFSDHRPVFGQFLYHVNL